MDEGRVAKHQAAMTAGANFPLHEYSCGKTKAVRSFETTS